MVEHEPLMDEELGEVACRICLSAEDADDLISPCECSGTCAVVHRKCLDRWRVANVNPRSMTHCPQCNYEYQLRTETTEERNGCCSKRAQFRRPPLDAPKT